MSSRFDDMAERDNVHIIYIPEYGGANIHCFPVTATIHKWFYYPRERTDPIYTMLTLRGMKLCDFGCVFVS